MRSVLLSAARELKLIFRDGIAIFLTVSPAALALIFMLVSGSIRQSSLSLAVDQSLPAEMVARLETVADMEYRQDFDSLKSRVDENDSIAGVFSRGGEIILLVEGNEEEGFAQSRQTLVSAALNSPEIQYAAEAVESHDSLAYVVSMTCVLLLALFIGGATLGLGGVDERENGVVQAIWISPMSFWGYFISKMLPAMLLALIGVSACALIMGRADALGAFTLLALSSFCVDGMILLLIIAFADNRIAAVGTLKIIMPLFLLVGVSAAFVPQRWLLPYQAIPMYWQYAAIRSMLSGEAYAFPLLMTFATGVPWLMIVITVFIKKMKRKVWR